MRLAEDSQFDCVVIGGGAVGLTSAYRLQQRGYRVLLLEAQAQAGGLAEGAAEQGSGEDNWPLESFYHHSFKSETRLQKLLAELGLPGMLFQEVRQSIISSAGTLDSSGLPAILRWRGVSWWTKLRFILATGILSHWPTWRLLSGLQAYRVSRWLSGNRSFGLVWGPLLRGKFGPAAERVSLAWLWARLRSRSGSRTSIFSACETLAYPRGGYQPVWQALSSKLGQNAVFSARVGAIKANRDEPNNYLVHYQVGTQTFRVQTRALLLAVNPPAALALTAKLPLAPQLRWRKQLGRIEGLGAICLQLWSTQSLSKSYWHSLTTGNSEFVVLVQHTNLIPSAHYGGLHVYYLGGYFVQSAEIWQDSDEVLAERWLAQLPQLFAHFDPSQLQKKQVNRARWAQHLPVQNYERTVSDTDHPLPGVFWRHFSQVFPADRGVEVALRQAEEASQQLQRFLGPIATTAPAR